MSHGHGAQVPQLPRLTRKQELAVQALLGGASDADAAHAAGVRRETVNRWRNRNAHFVAEMNRRRAETWNATLDGIRTLLPSAVAALRDALNAEQMSIRLRAARALSHLVGVGDAEATLRPPSDYAAPTDPARVQQQWESDAAARAEREAEELAERARSEAGQTYWGRRGLT